MGMANLTILQMKTMQTFEMVATTRPVTRRHTQRSWIFSDDISKQFWTLRKGELRCLYTLLCLLGWWRNDS